MKDSIVGSEHVLPPNVVFVGNAQQPFFCKSAEKSFGGNVVEHFNRICSSIQSFSGKDEWRTISLEGGVVHCEQPQSLREMIVKAHELYQKGNKKVSIIPSVEWCPSEGDYVILEAVPVVEPEA